MTYSLLVRITKMTKEYLSKILSCHRTLSKRIVKKRAPRMMPKFGHLRRSRLTKPLRTTLTS